MSLIKSLHHASLIVSDLAASRRFYEDLLGLKPSPKRPNMPFDGVWYEIGAQQIHLLVVPNPEQGLKRAEHGGRDRHTAVCIEDMDELLGLLEQAGIPHTLSQSGRRALFCRDPDDNAFEFIEMPTGKTA